jgi:membrane-associated protease RseP (regulator of RpoE activity)
LGQWSVLGVLDAVWPYLLMLVGFSVIVFVHELGHFAVAKWAGVRVDRFAIGFGREITGFTRGETRYSFNILPLGGYVKMLGQEDFDDKTEELRFKDDPKSFINKPVGHRMAIVSAGVVMNVLFACLLFMVVFMIGMDVVGPRIALVEPDSPADKAGLQPGDVVHEINGERILEFNEVFYGVLLAPPHEDISIVVERNGKLQPPIHIKPEFRRPKTTRGMGRMGRQVIGISPGAGREIVAVGPEIDPSDPHKPRPGDLLAEVSGIEVTDDNASEVYHLLASLGPSSEVYAERRDPVNPKAAPTRVRVEIPPVLAFYPSDPNDPDTVNLLGLTPLAKFADVDPGGRAYYAGLEVGDIILRWDDKPHPNHAFIARAVRDSPERDIAFAVRKPDGRTAFGFVRPTRNTRGPATIGADCEPADSGGGARLAQVRRGGRAAQAGLADGDVIVRINDVADPTCAAVNNLVRTSPDQLLRVSTRKPDGTLARVNVMPEPPGSIDANYLLIADEVVITSLIVPEINGRPSAAQRAGIPAGARIVAVNEHPVEKWRELIVLFAEHAGTSVDVTYVDAEGGTHNAAFPVPPSIRTVLGVGPEAKLVSIGGRETVNLDGDPPEVVTVGYHEGTRKVLDELVGQKNVTVTYRENLLGPLQTAQIDVTPEMTDPWLGRVTFTPNVALSQQTVLLKGENALDAVWIGVHKTYYFIRQVCLVMQRMFFSRTVGFDSVSGPLGIFDLGGKVARMGLVNFLFFLGIISANLAVINFLPLPIVDGGLMVFLLIEKIKGTPVSLRVQVATQVVGLALIIGVFVFVTYQDVVRMFG